jgi:hypothetical protein
VAEPLLDLAQVRAGAQQLGREHVPERVRGHPLALGNPGRAGVAEEGLGEDRRCQPPTLDAGEEGRLRVADAQLQ